MTDAERAFYEFAEAKAAGAEEPTSHLFWLLLERTEGFLNRGQYQCKVRGFGPDPAWAIFDLFLRTPDIEYALQSAQSESVSTIRSSPGIASRFRTGLPTRAFISSATRR